ncbi:hemicentin-1 isoform X2 [Nematostella vectensis]|uniref:hemicentin-1 isoform X2 n=1 Tax=Nematostella vectensis TaxID=45351 RepID=UPI0020770ADB|nr:hemicentin-1 isoform X2 [Nematostella vectensis]
MFRVFMFCLLSLWFLPPSSVQIVRFPSCGGGCQVLLVQTRPCNRFCANGGTPQGERCQCSGMFKGQCCRIVDGGWSEWSPWSSCTRTCDTGEQLRMRTCDNPYPVHDGHFCNGAREEIRECTNGRPCIIGGNGGLGSSGKRAFPLRMRRSANQGDVTSDDVTPNDVDITSNVKFEASGGEPLGSWGEWTSWSACSVTCGGGQRFRTRVCQTDGAQCQGKSLDVQVCAESKCALPVDWETP